MDDKNLSTITAYSVANNVHAPVKAAISEELNRIISEVYQLNPGLGNSLNYLTAVMMKHFHEDIKPVQYKDLTAIDLQLVGLPARLEKAKLLLYNDGFTDKVSQKNPVWYLNLALGEVDHIRELISKEG